MYKHFRKTLNYSKGKCIAPLKNNKKKITVAMRENTDDLIYELNTAKGKNSELEFRTEKMSQEKVQRDKNMKIIF